MFADPAVATHVPPLAAAAGALVGAAVAVAAVRAAVPLGAVQPVDHDLAVEGRVLDAVAARPELTPLVAELEPEDFTTPEHQSQWRRLRSRHADAQAPDPDDGSRALVDDARHLVALRKARDVNGDSPIVATEGGPVREPLNPSTARRVAVPVIGAALGAAAAAGVVATSVSSGHAAASAAVAVALGAALAVLGLVDLDTRWVDRPTRVAATALLVPAAAAVALVWSGPTLLAAAALTALAPAALIVAAAAVARWRTGQAVWGGGDTKVLVPLVFIVTCLSASPTAGLAVVLWAAVLGAPRYALPALRARLDPSSHPTPTVPFVAALAAAWPLAWAADAALQAWVLPPGLWG